MEVCQQFLTRGLISLLVLVSATSATALAQNSADYCDWQRGDPHKMHWPQLPDLSANGMDIDAMQTILADDFTCTATGPITGIHVWGSFADDIVPQDGPDSLSLKLSIYENNTIPDSRTMGNIFFAKSMSDGTSFGIDVMVDAHYTDTSHQSAPALAVDRDGIIHVVWEDYRDDPELPNIYYSKSTDGGENFGEDVMVDDTISLTSRQVDPAIAVDNRGIVHVVWEDYRDDPVLGNIYYAKSTDGGKSFGPDILVEAYYTVTSHQASPKIAVDGHGIIHVVWEDYRDDPRLANIYYSKSTDNGESFGEDVMVDDPLTLTSHQVNPALAVDEHGIVHAVWEDYRDNPSLANIYYAKSVDGGRTFGNDVMVDDAMTGTSEQKLPAIAVDDEGIIHVVWEDYRDNGRLGNIYYANSANGGASFGKDIMVDDTITVTSHQAKPAIEVDDLGIVHVIWEDYRDDPYLGSIYYCLSTDGGKSFLADVMVDDPPTVTSPQIHPAIALDTHGVVYVVWEDYRTVWSSETALGRPGECLWSHVFTPGEYTVRLVHDGPEGWYDPATNIYLPSNHRQAYQYSFCINEDEAWVQQAGTVYWLALEVEGEANSVHRFGWKTTSPEYRCNNDAVYLLIGTSWLPIKYPKDHECAGQTLDLAFVVTNDSSGIPEYNSKWSQPPIEWDLLAEPPIFCGWDEPAHASRPAGIGVTVWQLVADDFRCLGSMPVTAVHWWGSYLGWEKLVPPQGKPSAWHIAFWNNVSADDIYQYSRPSGPLWQLDVPADAVDEQYVGSDRFPGKSIDACFQYALRLDSPQFFQQQQYRSQTQDDIFWISITALYEDNALPAYPWGWKTRPQPWMGDAIQVTIHRDVISENVMLVPSAITPIQSHAICDTGEGYDMAFQLHTDSSFAKWEQSFTGIRHWPHYEDEESVASVVGASDVGVLFQESIVHQVADDFQYGDPHPITAAVWWGSYIGYDYTACVCQESVGEPEKPSYFLLSIWTDIPAGHDSTFSRPREKIWEYRAYAFDEVLVGYDGHPEQPQASSACEPVFRYSVRIPQGEWFHETTDENVYWFSVVAVYETDVASLVYPWGWTNHAHYFGGDAVARASDGPAIESYSPLQDETGDGEDMSFMLLTDPNETSTPPYQPTSRPVTATRCPVVDTQCPAEETRCPLVVSLCVVGTPTVCPATHTQCPEATVCPEEPTQCYVVHTLCPGGLSDPTICPPVETSCPVDETRCPIQVSRCIVCPGRKVQAPAQQASADSYVLESCSRLTSASAEQSRVPFERPCPIVDAKCPDIR